MTNAPRFALATLLLAAALACGDRGIVEAGCAVAASYPGTPASEILELLSALLPDKQIGQWVGDNSLRANFVASLVGALFYFATLTEVPITQALMEHGMAKGPVVALLLAGPLASSPLARAVAAGSFSHITVEDGATLEAQVRHGF